MTPLIQVFDNFLSPEEIKMILSNLVVHPTNKGIKNTRFFMPHEEMLKKSPIKTIVNSLVFKWIKTSPVHADFGPSDSYSIYIPLEFDPLPNYDASQNTTIMLNGIARYQTYRIYGEPGDLTVDINNNPPKTELDGVETFDCPTLDEPIISSNIPLWMLKQLKAYKILPFTIGTLYIWDNRLLHCSADWTKVCKSRTHIMGAATLLER